MLPTVCLRRAYSISATVRGTFCADTLDISHSGVVPVPLGGRPFLVGAEDPGLPRTLLHATSDDVDLWRFNNSKLGQTIDSVGAEIKDIVKERLPSAGAMLFRGLSPIVSDSKDFSKLAKKFGQPFDYFGGFAARTELAPGVMNATLDPPETTIEPHLEKSYSEDMPDKFFIYCHEAPGVEEGGQTPICDFKKVTEDIIKDRALLGKVMDNGVRYYRTLHDKNNAAGNIYNWQSSFEGFSKIQVEDKLKQLGYDVEWSSKGSLRYSYVLPALREHPDSGDLIWTNQSSAAHGSYYRSWPSVDYGSDEEAPQHTTHSDGTPLSSAELAAIRRHQWQHARVHAWQAGDLVVLDNRRVAHGRIGYPAHAKRTLFVALINN